MLNKFYSLISLIFLLFSIGYYGESTRHGFLDIIYSQLKLFIPVIWGYCTPSMLSNILGGVNTKITFCNFPLMFQGKFEKARNITEAKINS